MAALRHTAPGWRRSGAVAGVRASRGRRDGQFAVLPRRRRHGRCDASGRLRPVRGGADHALASDRRRVGMLGHRRVLRACACSAACRAARESAEQGNGCRGFGGEVWVSVTCRLVADDVAPTAARAFATLGRKGAGQRKRRGDERQHAAKAGRRNAERADTEADHQRQRQQGKAHGRGCALRRGGRLAVRAVVEHR